MINILKISDGKAGHISITDGVINAIEKNYDVKINVLNVTIRVKFFLSVLKLIFNNRWLSQKICNDTYDWLMKVFYQCSRWPDQKFDLIISSGGDTSFINIWLTKKLNIKNIYCSGLRGLSPELFSLIITTIDIHTDNNIKLEIAPTKIELDSSNEKRIKFCREKGIDIQGKYFILLIGGDGAGYTYADEDFNKLVVGFMNIVIKNEAKALITTSRRTGLKNEFFLNKLFAQYAKHIAYLGYFNQKPEKLVETYLTLASSIFVTQESGSMITESLFCRKPVFTLYPESIKEQKRYRSFLNDLIKKQRMVSVSIKDDLENINLNSFVFHYLEKLPVEDLAEKIKPFIEEIKK